MALLHGCIPHGCIPHGSTSWLIEFTSPHSAFCVANRDLKPVTMQESGNLTFHLSAIGWKDSKYSEVYGEEIQLDGWSTTQLNITDLRPNQMYRVTVWARTRTGHGQKRSIDIERTLGTGTYM